MMLPHSHLLVASTDMRNKRGKAEEHCKCHEFIVIISHVLMENVFVVVVLAVVVYHTFSDRNCSFNMSH